MAQYTRSKTTARNKKYLPISDDYNISQMIQTPTDFYRDGRLKAPQRIIRDKNAVAVSVNSQNDSEYDSANTNSYNSVGSQLNLKFKTSKGKKKVYNPHTSRWILDNTNARTRIHNTKIDTRPEKLTKKKSSPSGAEYPEGLTLDICSKYSKNETIDLDLVEEGDPDQDVTIIYGKARGKDRVIPGLLEYKGIPLSNIEYISSGTFGIVYKYSSDATSLKKYEIAVKTYKDNKDDEIGFVNDLNNYKKRGACNIINSKILVLTHGTKKTIVSIMELMDGTLGKLKVLDINDKFKIIKRAAEHLLCLKNLTNTNNISYTDLKEANLLFKCFKNKKMKIVIGDIGGICTHPSQTGSATYPPPESVTGPNCDEGNMVWGLGVTLLELLNYNTNIFYWRDARKINKQSPDLFKLKCVEEVENAISINKLNLNHSQILRGILDPNTSTRMTLKNIINSIEI